ncbi:MAG: hypothetical protein KF878_10700 [Planctomycetes bacterium]|nr:hypothetical protein [Planctomycetota bacterium]
MRLLALLAVVLTATAAAQEHAAPPAGPPRPLAFDAPPAGWRARPAEEKPFVLDFDLPAVEGAAEAARVNVLLYPMGFDDYRARLLGRWRRADGAPLSASDQVVVEALDRGDLRVRVVEQAGTYEPREGPPRPGWRLVAAHVRAPDGKWSVWLAGPDAAVRAHRAAYLGWLATARLAAAHAEVHGPACSPACPPGGAPADDEVVRAVREVHGAPPHGTPRPWALLGHRLGAHALARLGADRADGWQLVVTLRAPASAPAVAALDGLLVATGASPGKGNLRLEGAPDGAAVEVVVVHRPSGRALTYRVAPALAARLDEAPAAEFPAVWRAVGATPDGEAFTCAEAR